MSAEPEKIRHIRFGPTSPDRLPLRVEAVAMQCIRSADGFLPRHAPQTTLGPARCV
ncbi:hypothetical protein [Streptomyces sp. NPDC002520]